MGKKNIITEYEKNCLICGSPTTEMHHFLYGRSIRHLADEDGIYGPLCRCCHEELHTKSGVAGVLSKMFGQMAYEKHLVATEGVSEEDARKRFRERYGRSYL